MNDSDMAKFNETHPELAKYTFNNNDNLCQPLLDALIIAQKASPIVSRHIRNDIVQTQYPFDPKIFLKLWDYYRTNDPVCLAKYPSVNHIKKRHEQPMEIDMEMYKVANEVFNVFLTNPHQTTLMRVLHNTADQPIALILNDQNLSTENPFIISLALNTLGSDFDSLLAENNLPTDGNLMIIDILNLDGPFDEDPDKSVEE